MRKHKREFPLHETASGAVRCWSDATLTVYQVKQRKNVSILGTVHTGVGTFSGVKAKPESVMYNNTNTAWMSRTRCEGVLRQRRYGRWPVAVFCNILDLAGINAHINSRSTSSRRARRKVLQQLAGAEGRIHGGESGRGSRHKVGWSRNNHHSSSRHGHRGSAGLKELKPNQTSDTWNATSQCVVTVRGVEVLWLWPVITTALFCFRSAPFKLFLLLLLSLFVLKC